MMRGTLEGLFAHTFANASLTVARPVKGDLDAHGKPVDAWEDWEYLCDADAQVLQGEENPSHRTGGNAKYRLYIPADCDIPAGSLVDWGLGAHRVIGVPRTQPDGKGLMQCTLVDVERYEG